MGTAVFVFNLMRMQCSTVPDIAMHVGACANEQRLIALVLQKVPKSLPRTGQHGMLDGASNQTFRPPAFLLTPSSCLSTGAKPLLTCKSGHGLLCGSRLSKSGLGSPYDHFLARSCP